MTKTRVWAAIITVGFLFSLGSTDKAYADWSNLVTTSASEVGHTEALDSLCAGPSLYSKISGVSGDAIVCLNNQSHGLTVATSSNNKTYVGFPSDSQFSPVINCPATTCLFSVQQDTIITRVRIGYTYIWSLMVYSHATQRLHKQADGYYADLDTPDYVAWTNTGDAMPVSSMAISPNGQWLGLELLNSGFAIMNLETRQITKVSNTHYTYGHGMDPTVTMAVANDGKMLVVTGINATDFVVEVRDGCSKDLAQQSMAISVDCPTYNVADWAAVANGFQYAIKPWIDDGQITTEALYWPNVAYVVTSRTTGHGAPPVDYLGIGDSYTSGEGETDESFYQAGTNTATDKCHTSIRSYPYLVAIITTLEKVHNVACSGATIHDVMAATDIYKGWQQLDGQNPSAAQQVALDTFLPGIIPQADFVGYYQPRAVTVGIGGNDAGLMDKLRACVMPDECEWATASMRPQVVHEVGALFDKLVTLYQELHRRSPQTQLYAVGYPQIIDPDGTCDLLTDTMLNADERRFITETLHYLNQVIRSAAQKVGIRYLDIEQAYGTHRLCGGSIDEPALNLIQYGDDMAPIPQLPKLMLVGNGSFHPTPLGHQLVATMLHAQQADLRQQNLCGAVLCPQDVALPAPSDYWGNKEGDTQLEATSITTDTSINKGSVVLVAFSANTFVSDSPVRIELHSTFETTSSAQADHDGSVTASLKIPATIAEGYHTIHVYGASYQGNTVDLYQTVWVGQRNVVTNTTQANDATPIEPLPQLVIPYVVSPQVADTVFANWTGGALVDPEVLGMEVYRSSTTGHHTPQSTPSVYAWKFIIIVMIISVLGIVILGVATWQNSKNRI